MKKYTITKLPSDLAPKVEKYGNIFYSPLSNIEIESFQTGETIISSNNSIDKFRFMIEGRAKITLIHEDGKQSIVHFLKAEEYLGELTFLDIENNHKEVTAISDSIFISIDMKWAKVNLSNNSRFLFSLNQFIGRKMLARTNFNSKNQNYELRNRLAAYILFSQNNNIYREKHTETAEYLGVSYRHLLHTFKEFTDKGILIKNGKYYQIDTESLKLLSLDIQII
ncbi:cyclic nucleotide-binding domain-containing protein [Psychrilyobacter atlanticus]|uniref:cyclic nucleotide-binding domain-containing protein n=1 Tax=Psychrilyobacter atlanticus TaxID=271091 RepID=UPI00040C8777|nr:cyclic nucleotide-binding domain-containing protein [Psychrilyobacter atlanticus]